MSSGSNSSTTHDLAVAEDLALVELNPVIARPDGVTVVDALIHPPR